MMPVFLLASGSLIFPVAVLIALTPSLRRKIFFYGPVGVVLAVGGGGTMACALQSLAYGRGKYFLVVIGGAVLSWGLCLWGEKVSPWRERRVFQTKRVWLSLLVGALVVADCALILSRQDWGLEPGQETYFRPPFNNDVQRHTILVSGLLRGGEAPFIPHSRLTYQLFWYHLTAVFTWFFDGPTYFPAVLGSTLATLLLFSLIFAWSVTRVRPRWGLQAIPLLAFLGLALSHVDIYHFVRSLSFYGRPGIEADWSFPPAFFRYFSLKLVMLTAPQHSLFFVFLLVHLVGGRKPWLRYVSFAQCFVSSPVMTLFFFLPYWGYQGLVRLARPKECLRFVGESVLMLLCSGLLHWAVMGFSPASLFDRPGNPSVEFGLIAPNYWYRLPLLWMASVGIVGVIATLLLIDRVRRRRFQSLATWHAFMFWVGTIVFNYVLTGVEVRRHFSMVAAFVGSVFILKALPAPAVLLRAREWKTALAGVLVIAVPLHAYFIHSYATKPNHVDSSIRWSDYFEMNRIVRRRHPGMRIIAAVDHKGTGLDYPILMEATTSFSEIHHAAVHVRLSRFQLETFMKINVAQDVVCFAEPLGYEAMLWGPVERRVWGDKVKARFIREENLVAKVGEVAMYRLSDAMKPIVEAEKKKGGDYHFRLARIFRAGGWRAEAVDQYLYSIDRHPAIPDPRLEMVPILRELGYQIWADREEATARQLVARGRQ